MIYGILGGLLVSIILISKELRRLHERMADLENDVEKLRDHTGMTDHTLNSAVELIKANKMEEAVSLIQLTQRKRPHLV